MRSSLFANPSKLEIFHRRIRKQDHKITIINLRLNAVFQILHISSHEQDDTRPPTSQSSS